MYSICFIVTCAAVTTAQLAMALHLHSRACIQHHGSIYILHLWYRVSGVPQCALKHVVEKESLLTQCNYLCVCMYTYNVVVPTVSILETSSCVIYPIVLVCTHTPYLLQQKSCFCTTCTCTYCTVYSTCILGRCGEVGDISHMRQSRRAYMNSLMCCSISHNVIGHTDVYMLSM